MEKLKPTNDYLFKRIFGENKNAHILKDLLQSILTDIKISKVIINKDVSLKKQQIYNRLGILDIVATLDNNIKVNIEMQVNNYANTIDRSLFYEAGLFHDSLNIGEDYIDIPKVISIWITNYNVFDEGPFHERARLKRDYENIILTDKIELHYIQLPKFRKRYKRISNKINDKLEDWLTFIENEDLEAIRMIDNKYIQQAEDEFEYLTGDAEERRLAELREKAIRDEAAGLKSAMRKGIEKGYEKGIEKGYEKGIEKGIEKGMQKGIEKGMQKGIEKGMQKGIQTNKIETAKKMLAEKIDINTISKVTGLTKEEIKNL